MGAAALQGQVETLFGAGESCAPFRAAAQALPDRRKHLVQ
jgi:hypothetical protein